MISVHPRPIVTDKGYPNCGAGWYDVQGQGVCNDYCRWVGNCGCRGLCPVSYWSCALAGTNINKTPPGQYQEDATKLTSCEDKGTSVIRTY